MGMTLFRISSNKTHHRSLGKRSQATQCVESILNLMAHGDAREGKWRGNWRMEWVSSTLHTTSEHGVSSIATADCTHRLPVVGWTDAPADLNELVRFAGRRNLVSARVPSHSKRSQPLGYVNKTFSVHSQREEKVPVKRSNAKHQLI